MESNPILFHPVDYYNATAIFEKIFDGDKAAFIKSPTEVSYPSDEIQDNMNEPTFVYDDHTGKISVKKSNPSTRSSGEIKTELCPNSICM